MNSTYKPVKALDPETARKIAAGEVIDRPAAVIRELLDNALDARASLIQTEITAGGIDCIRVIDNGCGMTKEDLEICTNTHTTSKITAAEDLLALTSLGFRGEALSSIKAVSNLEITTTRNGPEAWKLSLGSIVPARLKSGTIVQVENLFENFPARKQFLKRPASETSLCRTIFLDKALPHYRTEMRFTVDGTPRFTLAAKSSLRERCLDAFSFKEADELFFEIEGSGENFSFRAVLGSPAVIRSDKRAIFIFVNGRRISEYGLVQAIEYGSEGYFPNGGHPVAFLFIDANPARVDFNIHPAKKEARFQDYGAIHHAVSSAVGTFFRQHTVASLLKTEYEPSLTPPLDFQQAPAQGSYAAWSERNRLYGQSLNRPESAAENPRTPYTAEYSPQITGSNPSYASADSPLVHETAHFMQEPCDMPPVDFKLLGQVAGTFIAVEKNDCLYLIDQHAAHERILFNQLKDKSGGIQELLVPYRIQTDSEAQDNLIRANQKILSDAGFTLSDKKNGLWLVSTVPARWNGTAKDLTRDLTQSGKHAEDILNHVLASAACRAACKDNAILDPVTTRRLVSETFALPEPICPHGRPVWIVLTREELFKRVKRT